MHHRFDEYDAGEDGQGRSEEPIHFLDVIEDHGVALLPPGDVVAGGVEREGRYT